MKKLIFFLMMFLTSIVTQAQTTYGGLGGSNAGQNGSFTCSYFGLNAGKNNITGQENSYLGTYAGSDNEEGRRNTFIGCRSGQSITDGDNNTFIGCEAGRINTSGSNNIYLGFRAGYKANGGANLMLGYQAGHSAKGSKNIFIGFNSGYNEIGDNKLYIDNSGTPKPLIYGDFKNDELTINGSLDLIDPSGATSFDIHGTDNGKWNSEIRFFSDGALRHIIADDLFNDRLLIRPGSGGNAQNLVHVYGSMIIGDDNSDKTPTGYKLYVKDGILTDKVKVAGYDTMNWSDYVFEEDYDRNSTKEVEQFIKANKHLPNVPSAKEVKENGVEMVEMDATLLRQIEELWLHVIDLKKESDTIKAENELLKTQISILQNR